MEELTSLNVASLLFGSFLQSKIVGFAADEVDSKCQVSGQESEEDQSQHNAQFIDRLKLSIHYQHEIRDAGAYKNLKEGAVDEGD